MGKIPKFLREFSKKESMEARNKTAETIKSERREYFTKKKMNTKN